MARKTPTLKLSLTGSTAKGFVWAFYRNRKLVTKSVTHRSRAAMKTSLVAFLKDVQADWFEVFDYTNQPPIRKKRK